MTIYVLQALGHTPGEVFSFGLHVDGPPDSVGDAVTAWATAVGLLWNHDSGAGNTLASHISSTVGIDDVSAAALDPFTGKQTEKQLTGAAHPGTSVEGTLPHSVALAVSLRTVIATRSGRGRFYLPPLDLASTDDGRVLGAAVTAAVNGAAFALNGLQSAGFTTVVYHRATLTFNTVVRVDVGDVFDDQRRRRNKLVEARTSVDLS
jgi:hypothetical protein